MITLMNSTPIMKKFKLAVLTPHPIQYQAPFFKKLAEHSEIDLMVYFCWDFGVKGPTFDIGFNKKIKWDIPLLDGYRYKFLKNFSLDPGSGKWSREINPGIIKEIHKGRYDAILIYGWNSLTSWLAFLAAFLTKTPVFIHGENPLNQESFKSGLKIKIKHFVLGTLFKKIRFFLYIGEENKNFFKYYGVPEEKLIFCPYAVENERFMSQAKKLKNSKSKFKKELGLNDECVTVLFMGKLIEKKRPLDLLKAYELLTKSFKLKAKNLALLFVGDGILRFQLEGFTKERNLSNVYFIGFKNQTELPKYYTLADVLVLPSGAGETWGLAVNEAMCFSLPIIISNIVGCGPDLVKNDENGFIFSLGDAKQLSGCLEKIIQNSQKRKLFGKKSFEIIKNYTFEKDIEGILTALKQA